MSRERYTRKQTIEAGRWAWSSSSGDAPDFYFDGAEFWHRPSRGASTAVDPEDVPQDGWWHAKDCVCALCRPRSRAGAAGPRRAGRLRAHHSSSRSQVGGI